MGPFRLLFYPSAHSPIVLGRTLFEGDIADRDVLPPRAKDYLCGVRTGQLVDRLAKASHDVRIGTLPFLGTVAL